MQRVIYTTLIALLPLSYSSAQDPVVIHSEKPEYSTFQELVHIEESHRYGVVDPFDSPEAWISISDIAPGPDNGILVTDTRHQRVDLLISGRGVVSTYGSGVGAGPGELSQPWASACDSRGQVFISEYGNVRVSIFNSDGEFIRSVRLEHIPGRIAVGEHQDLWVGRTYGSAVDQVDLYNLESGQLVASVGDRYRDEDWYGYFIHEPFIALARDRLIVSSRYPSDLVEYDHTGTNTRIITRNIRWLTPPEPSPDLPEHIMNLMNGQARQVAAFPDGSLLALIVQGQVSSLDPEPPNSFILDLIAPDGRWLTTIPISEFGRDWHVQSMTVAHDGGLWLLYYDEEDVPRIVRYNFEIVQMN